MSRVALAKTHSLTFYKDALTDSRRGQPISQLTCIGKPCHLYEPEVVRCVSLGGYGTEVDWKCEADLPEALRFGRVEVSCEGWDGPGDPYVLKGSCALNYRLVQVPDALRGQGESHKVPSLFSRCFATQDVASIIFMIIWVAVLLFILYSFLKSCFEGRRPNGSTAAPRQGPGPGSGWFPRTNRDDGPGGSDAPPPYTKYPRNPPTGAQQPGWRPGFWTGAALGGLGAHLFNRNQGRNARTAQDRVRYDWEQPLQNSFSRPSFFSPGSTSRSTSFRSDDRGEGPSDLGRMRRSTGMGGSNVR